MILPLLLAACACHRAPEPAASPPTPEPVAEAEAEASAPATPEGVAQMAPTPPSRGLPIPSSWSSPACEGRDYERQLRFTDGRFAAKDLVAPCPPGTLCVWSGILDRAGTWTCDRRQLRLEQDPDPRTGAPSKAAQHPLPEALWLAADGTLTEDGGACPYQRVE